MPVSEPRFLLGNNKEDYKSSFAGKIVFHPTVTSCVSGQASQIIIVPLYNY